MRRILKFGLGAAGVAALAGGSFGLYLASLQLDDNFHTVVAGALYRSAQPSVPELAGFARQYGIKTVVNLRGEYDGVGWYDREIAEAKTLGITHIDFRMSAVEELSQPEAAKLISLLAHAEKPILIHCKYGADRSSLAAALYVAAVSKLGEEAAEDQISIRFGHVAFPLKASYAIDRSFENLEPWLGFPNS